MEGQLSEKLAKEEASLFKRQKNQLETLLGRIQRDREEQVRHRQIDSNRLLQRNKNLVRDILEKQTTECRRTQTFLRYALGKREKKSEGEIKQEMAKKKYNPKNDPLMPRLFRKNDPSKSTILTMSRGRDQMSVFTNTSQYDNNKVYQKGQGYGSQRTYLCINPLRSMIKNREYAIKRKSLGPGETERALFKLEESYLETNAKHQSSLVQQSLTKAGVGKPQALHLPKI